MDIKTNTKNWYQKYYKKTGGNDRSSLTNPENFFQNFCFDKSFYQAIGSIKGIDKHESLILDVGCGSGTGVVKFIQLGFQPNNVYGIDILNERLKEAKFKYPNVNFLLDDARNMNFEDNFFDLVMQSTMFVQITDETIANQIAQEMIRVTKKNKYILLIDWIYGKPGNNEYSGFTKKRMQRLFSLGKKTKIISSFDGPLIPPIGRKLSKFLPELYFPIKSIFPFLVGAKAILLKKI